MPPDPPQPFLASEVASHLVDDGTLLFFALDGAGTIRWTSGSARQHLGRDPSDLVGTHGIELLHPADHEVLFETFGESVRGAEDRIRVPLRLRSADGGWSTFEFGGIDLRDEQGEGTFLVWGSPHEATGRLLEFLNALLAGAQLRDLLDQVLEWHDTTTPGTRSAVLVVDDMGCFQPVQARGGIPPGLTPVVDPDDPEPGPWADALAGAKIADLPDLSGLTPERRAAAEAAGFETVWAVPIAAAGRPPTAVHVLWRERPGGSLSTQRRQLLSTAQVLQLALHWSCAQGELMLAATTDPLTGLANRAQLDTCICADESSVAALLFVDLDDFKAVNDRHGHLVGDRILRESARRMAEAVRPQDLLVRLGGDEFAAWCPSLRSPIDADDIARRLLAVLDVPFDLEGRSYRVGGSIGVAMVHDHDPWRGDVDRVLGAADQALYRAKNAGGGRVSTAPYGEPLPFPD